MAQTITLKTKCTQCNGTGIHTNAEADGTPYTASCQWPGCVDGYIVTMKMEIEPGLDDIFNKCEDILDKCGDILDKCEDILEAVQEE